MDILRLVWPMYALLHVLHFSLYMPLLLCVGCYSMVFRGGLLLYRVCAFERYLDVCLFKEVCNFSDFGTMKCEDGPFLVFVVCFVYVGFVLSVSFQFCYVMKGEFVVLCDVEDFLPFCFFSVCCEG